MNNVIKKGTPMRRIVLPVLVMAVAALIFVLSSQEKDSGMAVPKKMRTLTPEQLLTRVNRKNEPLRLRTAVDILPGGYAAAMAPVMIDWNASRPEDDDPFVIPPHQSAVAIAIDGKLTIDLRGKQYTRSPKACTT